MIDNVKVSEKSKVTADNYKKAYSNKKLECNLPMGFSVIFLKDSSVPALENIIPDSNVEMTWKTFAGNHDDLFRSLLLYRLQKDMIEITQENISKYFKIYLHRGISFLTSSNFRNERDFLKTII